MALQLNSPETHLNTSTNITIKVIGLAKSGSSGVQIVTFGVLNLFGNQILFAVRSNHGPREAESCEQLAKTEGQTPAEEFSVAVYTLQEVHPWIRRYS